MPWVRCCLPPLQTGRANFPHPAFPEIFAGGMHEVNRLASQRNHRLGEPRGIGRLLGASSMWNDSPLTTIQTRQGPFARPALPGGLTTMGPSDSPRSQKTVIDSHRLLADRDASSVCPRRRVSQVPRLICRRPPSPLTPGSPTAAITRCFTVGMRLHHLWKGGHSHKFNEAESGSRCSITADVFAFQGFTWTNYSVMCSVGYMANEHLPWLVPFN